LTIEVSELDLREIALFGYADAASTDRKAQAVAIFVSDQCLQARDRSDRRLRRNKRLRRNGYGKTPPVTMLQNIVSPGRRSLRLRWRARSDHCALRRPLDVNQRPPPTRITTSSPSRDDFVLFPSG
jgi:hypothetical protein